MNSAAPFPLSSFGPEGEVSVALDAFRWLIVLGFPTAVAAASVWPHLFAHGKDDKSPKASERNAEA
jgi:hypothetical protein